MCCNKRDARTWSQYSSWVIIFVLATCVRVSGAPLFGDPRSYPVGTSPVGIAVGEFDAVPGTDLATADEGNTLTLLVNRGDGVFRGGAQISIPDRYTPTGLVSGTVNTDSITDLAISATDTESADFSGAVLIYRSTGALQFGRTESTVGLFPTCIADGDLTGDSRLDFAVCDSAVDGSGHLSLLKQAADGTFVSPPNGVALGTIIASQLAVSDVDHDGFTDLLVADPVGNAIWVLYGTAAGMFGPAVRIGSVDAPSAAVAVPFGSDTLPDIAVSSRHDSQVLVFRQQSRRVFGSATPYTVGLFPVDLASADFNGDGFRDLLVANNGSSDVTLLLGDAAGNFQRQETVSVGAGPVALAVADFNDDGKPDFATANQDDNTFGINIQSVSVVLYGVSPPFTPTATAPPTVTPTSTRVPTVTRTPTRTRTPSHTPTPPKGSSATPTRTPAGPADVNCDGHVDEGDIETIIRRIFDGTSGCLDREASAADIPFVLDELSTP